MEQHQIPTVFVLHRYYDEKRGGVVDSNSSSQVWDRKFLNWDRDLVLQLIACAGTLLLPSLAIGGNILPPCL